MISQLLQHGLSKTQAEFLRKSIQGITLSALFFVSPFAINNFVNGRIALGLFSVLILCIISYNAWSTLNGRLSYKISFTLLTPLFLLFFFVSIRDQQVIGLLWSYPALIMFYFILPERLARIANFALLLVVVPQVWLILGLDIALRAAATLLGASILCAVFVRKLNEQQLELELQAVTDPLTGLANRMKLKDSLDNAIRFSESTNQPLSILALDLDHFKRVNDQFGHDVGDRVLTTFGSLLIDRTRESDEVFRLGGEEFLIILRGTDSTAAIKVADKIHAGLADNQPLSGIEVTVSIGVAALQPYDSRHNLILRGDKNLYKAKDSGRNCTRA